MNHQFTSDSGDKALCLAAYEFCVIFITNTTASLVSIPTLYGVIAVVAFGIGVFLHGF